MNKAKYCGYKILLLPCGMYEFYMYVNVNMLCHYQAKKSIMHDQWIEALTVKTFWLFDPKINIQLLKSWLPHLIFDALSESIRGFAITIKMAKRIEHRHTDRHDNYSFKLKIFLNGKRFLIETNEIDSIAY